METFHRHEKQIPRSARDDVVSFHTVSRSEGSDFRDASTIVPYETEWIPGEPTGLSKEGGMTS